MDRTTDGQSDSNIPPAHIYRGWGGGWELIKKNRIINPTISFAKNRVGDGS